jgi:hypothetical protein
MAGIPPNSSDKKIVGLAAASGGYIFRLSGIISVSHNSLLKRHVSIGADAFGNVQIRFW